MSDEKISKLVQTTFSLYGLIITKKLSSALAKNLLKVDDNGDIKTMEAWLTKIIDNILEQKLTTPNVSIEHIKLALSECFKPDSVLKDTETVFNVIDAFSVPKILYAENKERYIVSNSDGEKFPDAAAKSLVFKQRLDLLWYRTQKNPNFAPNKFGRKDNKFQLVPIEYLLSESKTRDVCVMGLLCQLTEGQYYLEDYASSVKINLKKTNYSSSLIMEGNIVVATGVYSDGILNVEDIDYPPPQSSDEARSLFGDANTFGGPHSKSLKFSEKLETYEKSNINDAFVFLSEFWVDNPLILKKFKTLLSGYSEGPPVAFVLCGHFLSSPSNTESVQKLKDGFKKVAEMIQEFPLIHQNSKFVLVPGPFDLVAPKVLPRPPLPSSVMENFQKLVPGTILATNPCRIQYCTKEIVVFRENMLNKLCRNTIHYPPRSRDENGEIIGEKVYEAFAKSIIRQSHLCPLLFNVAPVYWKHDQALHLYPTPDLIVVADDFQPYLTQYKNCKVMNPGSFLISNFNFKYYNPSANEVEECNIPDDEDL